MYQTVNVYEFTDAFDKADRANNFSREGRRALFKYLEERDADMDPDGPGSEFCVISICCEYSEYSTAVEAAEAYGWTDAAEADEDEDPEDVAEQNEADALEWLRDETTVVKFSGGIIIKNF